jgi:hypothetical protein
LPSRLPERYTRSALKRKEHMLVGTEFSEVRQE